MSDTAPCRPVPSTDPDWPEPTLCQHQACAQLRRGGSQPGQPWANTPRGPVPAPPAPVAAMAIWLLENLQAIRQDEAAAELLADLQAIRSELRAAVDNRQYRYAGPCTAVLIAATIEDDQAGELITLSPLPPQPCGADLKHRVGAATIVCHECGAEYDAAERAAWIDKESADQLATGPMIAKALADAGYRVKPALIRNWAERTRQWMHRAAHRKDGDPPLAYEEHPIQQIACQVDTRLPLYRVGDVYRRVKADPERRVEGLSA